MISAMGQVTDLEAERRYQKGQRIEAFWNEFDFKADIAEIRRSIGQEMLKEPDEKKRNDLFFEAQALDRITGRIMSYINDNKMVDAHNADD